MRKCKSRAIKHVAPSAYAKCLRNFTYAKWLRHASAQAKWPTQLLKSSLLYKLHHFKKNRSSPERNSMEALDHLHRDKGEGREGQETNREDQSQTMDDDNKKKQKEMDAAATAQLEEEQSRALALPKSWTTRSRWTRLTRWRCLARCVNESMEGIARWESRG